jgi:hypothetical protein
MTIPPPPPLPELSLRFRTRSTVAQSQNMPDGSPPQREPLKTLRWWYVPDHACAAGAAVDSPFRAEL